MPGKKKKGARPPLGPSNDSLRADISAATNISSDYNPDDDGEDIAAQLLASLDARDAAEAKVQELSPPPLLSPLSGNHSHTSSLRKNKGKSDSLSSSGSASHGSFIDKILHPHTSRSPPTNSPPSISPPISTTTSRDSDRGACPRSAHSHSHGHGHGIISSLFGNHSEKKTEENIAKDDDGKDETGDRLPLASDHGGPRKVGRQKARKQRKEAAAAAERTRIEEELKANGGKVDEAELERQGLTVACEDLGVEMHEITPDGHCLYAAIADQLNLLGKASSTNGGPGGKENYKTTRRTTARWMREHEDDFRPFISDNDELMAGVGSPGGDKGDNDKRKKNGSEDPYLSYCDAVENTAVWGGQPEILAMSRAYRTPIWVIQSGSPIVKVGQDEFPSDSKPLMISYHRKMYGLGEHYNSLRLKSLMGSARRKIGGF